MFKNVKAQIERQNELISRAENLVNTAESEKRELTDAEAQELAEIRDDVKKIKEYLEIVDDIEGARTSNGSEGGDSSEGGEADSRACGIDASEKRAFEDFIRGSILHTREGELAKGNNGAIIPKTIAKKIIELVYDICPILEKSDKYNIKGKLEVPYYPANAQTQITVAYATEFTALTSSTGNFGAVELEDFLAGALTKISKSLINNVDFDLVAFVVSRMAYDIARFVEGELLNGTENKVEGMSSLDDDRVITTESASVITANELIDLQDSVKDVFQANSIWIMSSKTRTAIRKLTNEIGQYLLSDDISMPWGKSLLGKPVYVSDNMPEIDGDAVVIYYGDFSGLSTKFSEEMEIQVLRELFATEHAVGVVGWVDFDGKVTNQQKLSALKMHAS